MKKFLLFLASGFGVGYSKIFPGGLGAVMGFIISLPFLFVSYYLRLFLILVFTALAIFIADQVEKIFNKKDPKQITIDEIVGVLISSVFIIQNKIITIYKYQISSNILLLFWAFLLFVLMDKMKPFPAKKAQKIKGGIGIVLDDIIAGLYSGIIILAISFLI